MKKRFLAMLLSAIMVLSSIGANAIIIDSAETAELPAVYNEEENAELLAVEEEDSLMYLPADSYGNLIGSISFDYQNANRDPVSFAPALHDIQAAGCTLGYIADPLGERDGYVLDVSSAANTAHRIKPVIYGADDLDSLTVGKYTLTFDVYTTADTLQDSYFRLDLATSISKSFRDEVYANRGKGWITCVVDFEITDVTDNVATVVFGETTSTMDVKPTFSLWMQKKAASHVYLDDFRLYQYPEDTAAWIDHEGNRILADVSEMTAVPTPSEVINYSDDTEFAFWEDEDGNIYYAGTETTAEELKYKTFVGASKSYVYFEIGDEYESLSSFTVIPYPSEVSADWSDAGFYAWEDEDGNYYYAGDAASMVELADVTLTFVSIADYNATLPASVMNENGVLVLKEDFSTTVFAKAWDYKPFGYINSQYADTVYSVSASAPEMITDDDAHGTAFKLATSTTATNWTTAGTTKTPADPIAFKTGAGKYTVSYDVKNVTGTGRIDWNGLAGTTVSYRGTTWYTITESKVLSSAPTRIAIYTSTSATGAGDDCLDNICIYYMPENAVVFDNANGAQAFYYGDKNGNIVIPAPTGVNASWSDSTFAGWTATNGSVYTAGQTVAVSTLAGQVLKNEVQSATFNFGDETATKVDVSTIPYPSEVNNNWTDAGFYAWTVDGVYYYPGAEGDSSLLTKTLTAVTIADYNAATTDIVNENGILIIKEDFSTTKYAKRNGAEDGQNSWSYETLGYMNNKYATTAYSFVSVNNEIVDGAVQLVATQNTRWSTAGSDTDYKADGSKVPMVLKTGAGLYTLVYDVKSSTEGSKTFASWNAKNDYQQNVTAGEWGTFKSTYGAETTLENVAIYVYGADATNIASYDNINLYYMPENAVVFDNENGAQALYYGDKNGNIVIPAPSGVNADWSDSTFAGWTATNGTVYTAGQTVAASTLAGQVLKNKVQSVTFKLGDKTANVSTISTIPYPSEVDSTWSDAGFYAWVLDGVYYYAGEAGDSSLLTKTLTAVTMADYNATNTDTVNENGILIMKEDFSTTKYSKRNGAENGQNSWSYETLGYMNNKYVTTAYSFVSANNEIVDGAVQLVATQNTRWGTAGTDTDYKTDGSKAAMTLKAGAGLYTIVYDVKASTEGSKTFVSWNTKNDYQQDVTAGEWGTFKSTYETEATLENVAVYVYGADATNIASYDNICLYYIPEDAVVFDNDDGSYAIYFGDKNGNIVIPVPSGANANWSDEEFHAWKTSDGTYYNAGDVINVADFADKRLVLVTNAMNAPIMLNKASLRLTGTHGMRQASFVDTDTRTKSTEYGYIVSRKIFFDSVDDDYDQYFVIPEGFDTENKNGTLATINMPFLCGIAYNPELGIDKIYATDGSVFGEDVNYEDEFARGGVYFTCVLLGLEGYEQYHEVMVIRPYIKIGGRYFYGEVTENCLYDVALAYQQKVGVGVNEYVDAIVSATPN